MRFRGKIIGGLLGLLIFGPIGAAFGFIAGHLFDIGYFRAFIEATHSSVHTHIQKIFFENTFKIMGYVAKSDGRVSQNEIDMARDIMSKMRLTPELKAQAMQLFQTGKSPDFNLDHALLELRQICHTQPILLQLFLDIQWQIAGADGSISPIKKKTLDYICSQLGVSGFHTYGNYHQQHRQHSQYSHNAQKSDYMPSEEAYELLGITKNANDDEIKKAYRRLMSQNHPDKLIAKGLPPEMIKLATQKTQQIKKAYETLKKTRGF